ncbi:P-loop NTPase fold protein [Nostoc sp.]|uniref:P-loop NTPase fold protein n=1 Tax=Nostoc sp. TaxID=1180 RepID=UPI002FFCF61A
MADNTTDNADSQEQSTANVSPQADIDEQQESVNDAAIKDQPTFEDYLGFQPYVTAIATFLTNSETQPPLTLAIEGEWGSGKSSFMKQLEKAIERIEKNHFDNDIRKQRYKCEKDLEKFKNNNIRENLSSFHTRLKLLGLNFKKFKPSTVVWFNAWRHDKAEALWAAFALEFIRQISRHDQKRDRSKSPTS